MALLMGLRKEEVAEEVGEGSYDADSESGELQHWQPCCVFPSVPLVSNTTKKVIHLSVNLFLW